MPKPHAPEDGTGQKGLPLKCGRCISPQRASQILESALGHGYSRQSVYRLIEDGTLRAHRIRKGARLWVNSDSVLQLINKVLNEPPC